MGNKEPVRATSARDRWVIGQNRLQYFYVHARRLLRYSQEHVADVDGWLRSSGLFMPAIDDRGEVEGSFGGHEAVLSELVFCRTVDNYIVYLQDLVGLALEHHPQSIRLLKNIRGDVVVDSTSADDLHRRLAAFGRESLRGFDDLMRFFDKLGLGDFATEDARNYVAFAVEVRNLLVHNHGILEGKWLKRLPPLSHAVGNKLVLEFDAPDQLSEVVSNAVASLDSLAMERLGVPTS